jgi:hypothetical protein
MHIRTNEGERAVKKIFDYVNGLEWYWKLPATMVVGGVSTGIATGIVYAIVTAITWIGGPRVFLGVFSLCISWFMGRMVLSIWDQSGYDGTSSGR